MSSAAKQRRKARRAALKEQAAQAAFETAGLIWSDNPDIRTAALMGGFQELEDFGVFVAKTGAKSVAAAVAATIVNPVAGLGIVLSLTKDATEAFGLFQEGYNRALQIAGREISRRQRQQERKTQTEGSQKQVDIGTLGSKLPAQTIGMISPAQDKDQWKAWIVPALGLVAAFYLWRRS